MFFMENQLLDRIEKRLKFLDMKPATASLAAGLSKDAIRNLQRGTTRGMQTESIAALAPVLKTSIEWLSSGKGQEDVEREEEPSSPNKYQTQKPSNNNYHPVPVMGKAAGAVIGASNIADEPIEFINLPVATATIKDIYALWVEGTSMLEKYEPGEPIVVAPHRTVRANDFVVVQVIQDGELRALVKRYVSRDENRVKLEQFNPKGEILIPHEQIHAIHRILSLPELIGLSI